MEFGHAIDGVAADDREVGHAHLFVTGALLHDGHSGEPVGVPGMAGCHGVEEATIDLLDHEQVAGQNAVNESFGPFLEGFGEKGVVGEAHCGDGDFPCLFEWHALLVDEQAHQFGNGECGVGVVELHGNLGGEFVEGGMVAQVAAQDIAQSAGHEEVLLEQAQLPACLDGVGGVQHLGDVLRDDLVLDSGDVVALVEFDDVEFG